MNIVFATQFFPPPGRKNQTGGTISNLNLMRGLACDHAVKVLSFDPASDPEGFVSEPFEVIYRPAPCWRALDIFRYWADFVRSEVNALLTQSDEPDVLLSTTSSLAAFDVTSVNVKRVAIIQAFENFGFMCPWVPAHSRIQLGKGAILRKFQDARQLREADAILTNSSFMQGAISMRFSIERDHIYILPQQVNVASASTPKPERVVGFVHRGPDKKIALVKEIASRSPDLKFLIFGHQDGLPDDLPENMELRGWSSDRDTMFASATLWLVPSLWSEPFGRVSIEAQAAERAVLVADCGGLPETIVDTRFLIAGYDPQEWLERIRQLLEIPSQELAMNGAYIRTRFSAEAHDIAVSDTFFRIMSASRGKLDAV